MLLAESRSAKVSGLARKLLTASLLIVGLLVLSATYSPYTYAQEDTSVSVGDTSLDLSGQTSPDAYVIIRNGSDVIGALTADSSGNFSQSFPAQTSGINMLSIFARDSSSRITDTATLQVNLQSHMSTAVHVFLPPSLSLDTPNPATKGQQLTLSGQTWPGGTVAIWLDNQNIESTVAAADGNWGYGLDTSGLQLGTHQVFARVTDNVGAQSYPTSSYTFGLSATPAQTQPGSPNATSLPVLLQIARPHISAPVNNAIVRQSTVTITGEGPPITQIEVWNETRSLGSVWSDYRGNWQLPLTFSPGSFTLRARACADNYCGEFSPAISFTYQAAELPQQRLQATINHSTLTQKVNDKAVFQLQIRYGNTPFQLSIDWGDGSTESTKLYKNNTIIEHIYQAVGRYSGHVTISDSNGRQELRFTVNVKSILPSGMGTSYKSSDVWLLIVIVLVLWLIRLLFRRLLHRKNRSRGNNSRKKF